MEFFARGAYEAKTAAVVPPKAGRLPSGQVFAAPSLVGCFVKSSASVCAESDSRFWTSILLRPQLCEAEAVRPLCALGLLKVGVFVTPRSVRPERRRPLSVRCDAS